ncbi:MAG: right-handed parallel beta-helix repeat-containing protein [Trueperaceae bacterium]|nr:right-handed parallel beta-helix repeat-containing protein [Trueperaceae bacterium]
MSERTGDLDAWRRARRRLLTRGVRGAIAMGLTGLGATSLARDAAAPAVDVPEGASLQAAIDRAEPGEVIRVGAGTFTETVVIEKPLTLLGAGYGRTVLSADRGVFRWSGLPRERYVVGALNVRDTRDVNIVGFTLRDALEGVWISASRNVRIRDCMSCEHDSSGYYLWASQDCIVERCEGSTSAVGIYQGNSVDITIQRNVFRHNHGGRVPHLDNDRYPGIGILMGNVSLGCMVIGNALIDNVDWGVGVSLGVRDVRLLANEIRRNDVGVFAGERNVRMHGNAVTDNATFGVDGAGTEVDARHNWWGAEDGPGGVGPGGGDAVTDGVRYRPWRATPAPVPSHGPREDPPEP